jgi:hypothetical protein
MKQYTTDELAKIAERCKEYIECDTARISRPVDEMYLIIGFNHSTKDLDCKYRLLNGERVDYDYVHEITTIVSGYTEEELIVSAKEYQRLCKLTWEEHFEELRKEKT